MKKFKDYIEKLGIKEIVPTSVEKYEHATTLIPFQETGMANQFGELSW